MEFGFDDSLFEHSIKKASNHSLTSYNAKVCELLWFQSTSGSDTESELQLLKYNGDYNYRQKQYELAAKNYADALGLLPKHNAHMRHDMKESLMRCWLRLGQTDEAQIMAEEVMHSCSNIDQELQALSLLQQVYHTTSQWREEYVTLVRLVMLQPPIARFWWQLVECVRNILDDIASGKCTPDLETNNVDPSGDQINDAQNLEDHLCNVTGGRRHSADYLMFDNNGTNQSICLNELNCQKTGCISSERGWTGVEGIASVKSDSVSTSLQSAELKMPTIQALDLASCQRHSLCETKTFESNTVINSVPDIPKCHHKRNGDTGNHISDRHSCSFDVLQGISLHHVLTVCLCRARCLLKMSYYSTASFGRDTYDNQLKQIDASIHNLDITSDELDRIIQLTSDTAEETEQSHNTKIGFHQDNIADFERKWFINKDDKIKNSIINVGNKCFIIL